MAARLGEDGNRQALAHFVTTSPCPRWCAWPNYAGASSTTTAR
ncbi:hypothetical protein [Streptomyces sp. NPDC002205]